MKHGSLFSGIGGFDLAAEWMGWENMFHCEWNEFGQKVLKYYWPEAETFTDITKSDFTKYANRIDVLTGGFPCQPYSQAGKRLGKEDDRHLWPEMLRAIREIQPRWVVGENVRGLTNWNEGMVFDEVQTDLETAGYEVTPFLLPACAVNAPHRRDRIWFVAYSHASWEWRNKWEKENERNVTTNSNGDGNRNIERQDRETDSLQSFSRQTVHTWESIRANTGNDPNTSNTRFESMRSGRQDAFYGFKSFTNTCNKRLQRSEDNGGFGGIRQEGNKQFAGLLRSNWENFPTQPPLRSRNDGISTELSGITFSKHRNESIKAYGNAIVPQVAFQIFKAIEQYEDILTP